MLGDADLGSAVPLHSRSRAVLSEQPVTSLKAGKHVRRGIKVGGAEAPLGLYLGRSFQTGEGNIV